MGDLVHDALRATGIDEEVEQLIANAVVQRWNKNRSKSLASLTPTARKFNDRAKLAVSMSKTLKQYDEPNLVKIRLIAEHLWRRLEQIYDCKLQTWKRSEEKMINEMITKLRQQYKENLLLKKKELDELAERKDDEYKNKEDLLREDIRMTFEDKKLECERAWRKIEMAQKELRFQEELLDNARANFQSKKDHELFFIEQEKCSLEKIKESLKIHERSLDQRLQDAIKKGREKDRMQLTQLILEWNKKEAILLKKYEAVWNKICEISTTQQFSTKEAAFLKKLQEKMIQQQKELRETKQALNDAIDKQRKTSEDLELIRNEKEKLSETNQILMEKLERRDATISSLKKQLKLLEESASLRISDLRFQQKLVADKLQVVSRELHRYQISALEKFDRPTSHYTARMTAIDSSSSSTPTESSFEQHFRDRMKVLNCTKQKLDFALDKLCVRCHSLPLDYIQPISLSHAETNEPEKQLSKDSSSHEIKNARVDLTKDPLENHNIDPLMVQYMKTVQDQREKVESLFQQTPKKDNELPEETFIIETGERPGTPSDFEW